MERPRAARTGVNDKADLHLNVGRNGLDVGGVAGYWVVPDWIIVGPSLSKRRAVSGNAVDYTKSGNPAKSIKRQVFSSYADDVVNICDSRNRRGKFNNAAGSNCAGVVNDLKWGIGNSRRGFAVNKQFFANLLGNVAIAHAQIPRPCNFVVPHLACGQCGGRAAAHLYRRWTAHSTRQAGHTGDVSVGRFKCKWSACRRSRAGAAVCHVKSARHRNDAAGGDRPTAGSQASGAARNVY